MHEKIIILLHMCMYLFYLWFDFKLVQAVRCYIKFCKLYTQEQYKIFLYLPSKKKMDLEKELIWYIIIYIVPTFIICIVLGFLLSMLHKLLLLRLVFLFLVVLLSFTYSPDQSSVRASNNLNIGYGAALWYYENYLKLFLPHNFLQRVECFKSYNKVSMEKKLFILVPKSCKVLPYLDCDTELIERCRELPKHEETRAGVKGRVYNITVYSIREQHEMKWTRMAIEYAQPLKGLYALKEEQVIMEEDMFNERRMFVLTLQQFLRDQNNSYQFCELIEYDDDKRKISEILLEKCSVDK